MIADSRTMAQANDNRWPRWSGAVTKCLSGVLEPRLCLLNGCGYLLVSVLCRHSVCGHVVSVSRCVACIRTSIKTQLYPTPLGPSERMFSQSRDLQHLFGAQSLMGLLSFESSHITVSYVDCLQNRRFTRRVVIFFGQP